MFEYKGVQHAVKFKPFSEFDMLRLGNGNSSYYTPALLRHFARRLDLPLEAQLGYIYDDIFQRWLPEGFDPAKGVGSEPSALPRISEADAFLWPRSAGEPQQPGDAELSLPVWLRKGAEGGGAAAGGAAGQAAETRPTGNSTRGAGGGAGSGQAVPEDGVEEITGMSADGSDVRISMIERALSEPGGADAEGDEAKAVVERRRVVVMTVGPESRPFLPMLRRGEEEEDNEDGAGGGRRSSGRRRRSAGLARPAGRAVNPVSQPLPAKDTGTIILQDAVAASGSGGAPGGRGAGAAAGRNPSSRDGQTGSGVAPHTARGAAGGSARGSSGSAGGAGLQPQSLAAWLSAKVGLGRAPAQAAGADTARHPAERGAGQGQPSRAQSRAKGLTPATGAGQPGVRFAGAARDRGAQPARSGSGRAGDSSRASSARGSTGSRDRARTVPTAEGAPNMVNDQTSSHAAAGKQGRGERSAGSAAVGTASGSMRGASEQQRPWWEDDEADALGQHGPENPGRDRPRAAAGARPVADVQRPHARLGSGRGNPASVAGGAMRDQAPSDKDDPYWTWAEPQRGGAGRSQGADARESAAAHRGSGTGGAARAGAQRAGGEGGPGSDATRRLPPAADGARAGAASRRSRGTFSDSEDGGVYGNEMNSADLGEGENDGEDAWDPLEPAGGTNTRRVRRSKSNAADAAGRPGQGLPSGLARDSGGAAQARESGLRHELSERGDAGGSRGGSEGAARSRAAKRLTGGRAARQRGGMRQLGRADQFHVDTPDTALLGDATQEHKDLPGSVPSAEEVNLSWRGGRQGVQQAPEGTEEPEGAAADDGDAMGPYGGQHAFLSA